MGTTVVVERREGIALLRMNRPDRLNALNRELVDELHRAFLESELDPDVRAVVLTGNGRAFCSGGDLREAHEEREIGPEHAPYARTLHAAALMTQVEWMGTPVIAMVNGLAYAGGLALVLSSDLAVASHDAAFCVPEAKLGFVDPYIPARLAARVGVERAKDLMLTARAVSAAEGLDWGLVSRLAAPEELEVVTMELAGEVARNAPSALREYKHMVRRTLVEYDLGTYGRVALFSQDASEGVRSFAEGSATPGDPPASPPGS